MIRRAPRPTHSFVILRNEVARDARLSYRARGLLVAILSRPDNWTVRAESLANEGSEGRDAVRKALTELERAGYLIRTRLQDDAGKWYWESMIYDVPQPKTDSQASVNQGLDHRPTDSQASLEEPIRITEKKDAPDGDLSARVKTVYEDSLVNRVFADWLVATNRTPARTKLDSRRRKRIEWALKTYGYEETYKAIQGLKASKWHNGQNPDGKTHNELTLVLRDSATFERFRDMAQDTPKTPKIVHMSAPMVVRQYCDKCQEGYIYTDTPQGRVSRFCECTSQRD